MLITIKRINQNNQLGNSKKAVLLFNIGWLGMTAGTQ